LIPVPGANSNLGNVAIRHFLVHWIRRLIETGVHESHDLSTELSD